MAKTRGAYGLSFRFKKDTPKQKYEGWVKGEKYETTAVSEAQAKIHIKIRYNAKHGLASSVWQDVEGIRCLSNITA